MRIWIVNPYGELPSEGWREYRSFMLAKALAERGHEVTWWISDFIHRSKSYRAQGELSDPLLPQGVRVVSVHSTSYTRNISWQRIQYEQNYGKEVARLAAREIPPDVIVMGDPALFFSQHILAYRKKVSCKLVLDVIDLWPELFSVVLPRLLKPFERLIFHPLYRRRKNLVKICDGVVAVSQDYLDAALRDLKTLLPSLVVYWGIDTKVDEFPKTNSALNAELQSFKSNFTSVAVYAGTLGDAYDMDIIISAIRLACSKNLPIGFIIAGDGPRKQSFLDISDECASHLKFVGKLPASDMMTLYENCDIGLMTYIAGSTVAMPIKFYDYLMGGLAILSSLERDIKEVISNNLIGKNYIPGSPKDFLDQLQFLVSDPIKLRAMKCKSKSLVKRYDTDIQYLAFSEFIENLVN